MFAQLTNIRPMHLIVRKTCSNKIFGSVRDSWLCWKMDLCGIEHRLVTQNIILRFSISKGSTPKKHLEVNDTYAPDVHFVATDMNMRDVNATTNQMKVGTKNLSRLTLYEHLDPSRSIPAANTNMFLLPDS
jgi:hypothetical protein